jgi:hypothetical protein
LVLTGKLKSEAKGNAEQSANGGAKDDFQDGFHGFH